MLYCTSAVCARLLMIYSLIYCKCKGVHVCTCMCVFERKRVIREGGREGEQGPYIMSTPYDTRCLMSMMMGHLNGAQGQDRVKEGSAHCRNSPADTSPPSSFAEGMMNGKLRGLSLTI